MFPLPMNPIVAMSLANSRRRAISPPAAGRAGQLASAAAVRCDPPVHSSTAPVTNPAPAR
jgi:hypothetical protein